jgi:hypothetical protein
MSWVIGNQVARKNNLVIYLDAGNPKSYPGSGTLWKDLSGNNNNATLTNVSFNPNNLGYMEFNGSTSYADISNSSTFTTSTGSIEIWFSWQTTASLSFLFNGGVSSNDNIYLALGSQTGTYNDESLGILSRISGVNGFRVYYRNGETYFRNSGWTYFVTTMDGVSNKSYLNGSPVSVSYADGSSTTTGYWLNSLSTGDLRIGQRYTGSTAPFEGNISMFKVYSSPLTDQEVLYNYNISKYRYT